LDNAQIESHSITIAQLENDDDWTFVIKMHAIVEAGLNHLLKVQLDDPKLIKIVTKLPTNDKRRGKLALIKTYDLLNKDCRQFVRLFSDIRNSAVHDVKSFGLDLTKYVASIKDKEKTDMERSILLLVGSVSRSATPSRSATRSGREVPLSDSIRRSATQYFSVVHAHFSSGSRSRNERGKTPKRTHTS